MKKLVLILTMMVLPSVLFAQYTLEWERFVDPTGGNGFASKVIETPIREYYVSIANSSRVPFIKRYSSSIGDFIRTSKFGFSKFEKLFPNFNKTIDTLYCEDQTVNSFLLQYRSLMDIRYLNVFRKNNDNKKYLFNAYIEELNGFTNNIFMDTVTIPSKFTSIALKGRNYLYLDVSSPIQTQNNELLYNYTVEEKDILFKSINKVLLSPDTLSKVPNVSFGVPRALEYFADSSMVVVISSEEVPTSKPVGISFRIVNKSMQEIGAFRILNDSQYTNYNVSIVDAAVIEDTIYVVGYEYLQNSTLKRGFIASVTKQGQFIGYKYLTPEGVYSKIQAVKIHGKRVVCVGAMSDSPDNLTIVPYLVSYNSQLDESRKIEFKWTDTGVNSLYDYIVTFDNNAIVVGSKGGRPYMAKLLLDPKTSVIESSALENSSTRLLPNPSTTEATITMMNRTSTVGTIDLFSVEGKHITEIYKGELDLYFKHTFSTRNYPNGSYFVVIKGENLQETIPLTIQR